MPLHFFDDFACHYFNIFELCKSGEVIPPISEKDSFELLQKLKANVNDIHSVMPNLYKYAGHLVGSISTSLSMFVFLIPKFKIWLSDPESEDLFLLFIIVTKKHINK